MEDLIKLINDKLPNNCIYKIALISSVYAGRNNYCHHVLLAERIRPIIIETRYASNYVLDVITSKTKKNKECKKIYTHIRKIKYFLNTDIVNFLTKIQYLDNAFFSTNRLDSELYSYNNKRTKFRKKE